MSGTVFTSEAMKSQSDADFHQMEALSFLGTGAAIFLSNLFGITSAPIDAFAVSFSTVGLISIRHGFIERKKSNLLFKNNIG